MYTNSSKFNPFKRIIPNGPQGYKTSFIFLPNSTSKAYF